MSRIGDIERYREKTLDRATLVAALSTARLDELGRLGNLNDRKDAQLTDIVHDLAFNARKLIELVSREKLASVQYADRTSVFCGEENDAAPEDWPIVMKSLRYVFGRIIHSDQFSIVRAQIPGQGGNLSEGHASWAFRVASDRDPPGTTLFVYLEFLLSELIVFDEHLSRDLRWRSARDDSEAGAI